MIPGVEQNFLDIMIRQEKFPLGDILMFLRKRYEIPTGTTYVGAEEHEELPTEEASMASTPAASAAPSPTISHQRDTQMDLHHLKNIGIAHTEENDAERAETGNSEGKQGASSALDDDAGASWEIAPATSTQSTTKQELVRGYLGTRTLELIDKTTGQFGQQSAVRQQLPEASEQLQVESPATSETVGVLPSPAPAGGKEAQEAQQQIPQIDPGTGAGRGASSLSSNDSLRWSRPTPGVEDQQRQLAPEEPPLSQLPSTNRAELQAALRERQTTSRRNTKTSPSRELSAAEAQGEHAAQRRSFMRTGGYVRHSGLGQHLPEPVTWIVWDGPPNTAAINNLLFTCIATDNIVLGPIENLRTTQVDIKKGSITYPTTYDAMMFIIPDWMYGHSNWKAKASHRSKFRYVNVWTNRNWGRPNKPVLENGNYYAKPTQESGEDIPGETSQPPL